ncbi:hypothetical protein D9619_002879 [Psilocybe cf. subviscida]|uniref:Amino-acid acetyltransferase, mitochondrial n=1 Tax=Psilocybe cf. subviscida TaxID=2480587 RepID=A0A8H5AZ17_9AGAR|nr:hypothetical protein D9619_002879 [Psilocybe cf. subviscida]
MELPDELLVHILENLDYRDLLRCIWVCKNFKEIIDGTAALQYTIELAVSGQRNNCHYDPVDSSKEKLDRLKKHQEAWKELKWSRDLKIPMSSGGLWEIYGGVLAQNTEQGEIQFYQLPSDLRGIEEKRWTLPGDFGFVVRDFSMDPGQDLLVLVQTLDAPENDGSSQYRVHFYTMSTGKPHPLASRSMVVIPQTHYDAHVFCSIQVFGDLVGVHFCPQITDENVIALWNWKTGELQIHIYGEELASFTLLSDRWMLFAFSDEFDAPRLNVVDFMKEPSRRCTIDELETNFELEYPPLSNRDAYVRDMQLRADPGCFVDNRPGVPYSQNTKDFTIVFTTELVVRNSDRYVIQFISAQLLLDFVEEYAPISRDSDGNLLPPASYIEWTVRSRTPPPEPSEDIPTHENDFILSILRTNPSLRDAKAYLASFGLRPQTQKSPAPQTRIPHAPPIFEPSSLKSIPQLQNAASPSPVVASILNPIYRRTALVKIQGPYTDVQLDSICRGLVYLEKLGLVSVIVVENVERPRGDEDERSVIIDEVMRVVTNLEKQGSRARPVVGAVVRLGPKPGDDLSPSADFEIPETHTKAEDLIAIRSALNAGEIPVIAPFALDSFCRSVRVDANDVIAGLTRGMVEASALSKGSDPAAHTEASFSDEVDLTPLRLMIIDRNGGVPSYARSGYPHLLINLTSEYEHIHETFDNRWMHNNPTALSNLALARTCLNYMPSTSSAVMVSHKSPSSLIGNLITNKPAVSSSLPHALLQGNRSLTPHTPTLIRRGLPIQVLRSVADLDKAKLDYLLEQSFGRTLDADAFYKRLDKCLDFVIVAGDYAGAAIVTNEISSRGDKPISYLDKFAVLPSHQGDGTVDFLWVALHDESYGLGHPFSANPNGGKGGMGEGRDLVWRSRSNNPVNKWYFERSSGHVRMGSWVLFWSDAEKRLKIEEGRRGSAGLSYVEDWEHGRLADWGSVVPKIPSSWK